MAKIEQERLIEECSKLDPDEEKAFAEEGLGFEVAQWPEYQEVRYSGPLSIRRPGMNRQVPALF